MRRHVFGIVRRWLRPASCFVALTLGLGVGVSVAPGCSVLTKESAVQCERDADCAAISGTVCVSGLCKDAPPPRDAGADAEATCTSNQDCTAIKGALSWCRRDDGTCVSLVSAECGQPFGAYADDDAVLLGALLPLPATPNAHGVALRNALSTAVADFNDKSRGAPDARPLAFVVCDDTVRPDRGARYLAEVLRVPAIVTPIRPSVVTATASFAPVLLSPAHASHPSQPAMGTEPRILSLVPPASTQARALAAIARGVIVPAFAKKGKSSPSATVVASGDPYGVELSAAVATALGSAPPVFTSLGAPITLGDPAEADFSAQLGEAAATLAANPPDVVVLLGGAELVPLVQKLENVATVHPVYLASDGLATPALVSTSFVSAPPFGRFVGVVPGPSTSPELSDMAFRLGGAKGEPNADGVAASYDAVYALGYALSLHPKAPTAALLADDLLRVTSGTTTEATGPKAVAAALSILRKGGSINLDGASGDLALDAVTRDADDDFAMWCVAQGALVRSLTMYDHEKDKLLDGPGCSLALP